MPRVAGAFSFSSSSIFIELGKLIGQLYLLYFVLVIRFLGLTTIFAGSGKSGCRNDLRQPLVGRNGGRVD
jgi:hypothetical protein